MKKSLHKIFCFTILVMTQVIVGFNAMSQTTEIFNTAGSFQWTCPADVVSVKIEVWGGGGGFFGIAQRGTQHSFVTRKFHVYLRCLFLWA